MGEEELGRWLLGVATSPELAGVALWLVVGGVLRALPEQSDNWKYWFAVACAFVIPPGAVGLRVALGYEEMTLMRVVMAVGVGFLVATSIKRATAKIRDVLEARQLGEP